MSDLLLIEDDATTREVMTLLLESDGWTVFGAETGESALEALRQGESHPGVVLCDLHLPGVQGPELAAALRVLLPEALLLAMSASEAGDAAAGYQAVLRKPFGPADLRASLQALPIPSTAGVAGSDAVGEEAAVLSPGKFLMLEQQMGVRAKDLYAFALADAGDRLRRMEQSLGPNDMAAYRSEAHALKGSAGMIGAERLAALAGVAELGTGDHSRNEIVHRMHLACDEIRLMLETLFPM